MKKSFKTVALALAVIMIATAVPFIPAKADTPGSTLEKIKQAEEEKKNTEKAKEEAEQKKQEKEGHVQDLNVKKGELKAKLNELNDEMTATAERLQTVEGLLAAKEEEIEITLVEIEDARATEEAQYEAMKKRFQASYEAPRDTYFMILLGSTSFGAFLNNTDYLRMLADYDNRMLDKYIEAKEEVIAREEVMEEEKAELEDLKAEIEEEEQRLTGLIDTANQYVAQYQAQINSANQEIDAYQKDIEAKEAEIKQKEADIAALWKQYEKELALSRAAQAAAWRDISQVTFEDGDRALLAAIIYCEAGAEPYEGQLAVGAVVINRVLSSKYPNTVSGVVYQPYQFSPAGSGRLALVLGQGNASASCYQAADQAMAGASNVGTCLYFRTPVEGMQGIRIGGHIFY